MGHVDKLSRDCIAPESEAEKRERIPLLERHIGHRGRNPRSSRRVRVVEEEPGTIKEVCVGSRRERSFRLP